MADAKMKMVKLASRVKSLTPYEELRVAIAILEIDRPTREAIKKSIARTLNESETRVGEKLAEHSDSDRILDELIAHLNSATGDN